MWRSLTGAPDADDERGEWTPEELEAEETAQIEAVTASAEAESPRDATAEALWRREQVLLDRMQETAEESRRAPSRRSQEAELYGVWLIAVELQDFRAAASLAGQYHRFLETEAKLLGDLVQGDQHIHIEITNSPEYRRLVAFVMSWLSDKPEVAGQFAEFLEEQERAAALEAKPTGNGTYDVEQHFIAS